MSAAHPDPQPMISTFPSVTNVAFTAILSPFGVDLAGGYEVAFFDLKENKVIGGSPFGYEDRLFAWRDAFDVTSRTVGSKFKTYTRPRKVSLDAVVKAYGHNGYFKTLLRNMASTLSITASGDSSPS